MTTDVLMPQMGLEVIEATVLDVLVAVGDEVAVDAPLIELETEKATTEIVAPRAGFVVAIEVSAGQVVPVGARLAAIADTADEVAGSPSGTSGEPSALGDEAPASSRAPRAADDGSAAGGRLRCAPVARRAAERLGVVLAEITGSGPRGRITLRDVEAAAADRTPSGAAGGNGGAKAAPRVAASAHASAPAPAEGVEPLSGLRRAIARRMTESQLIPQYQLQRDVDASHLLAQKDAQVAGAGKSRPGVNDLLMQAIAEMVVRHPALATSFVEEPTPGVRRHEDIGIGLAVATDRGLLVPVLRAVHRSGLRDVAAQRQVLVAAAREGRLTLDQMSGGAITLSNLGGFGIDRFTAMLNPGESAIVAVGRVIDRVVPRGRGLAVVPILTVTLSFDHRTVDGAVGAAALAQLAELLEGGMTWRP